MKYFPDFGIIDYFKMFKKLIVNSLCVWLFVCFYISRAKISQYYERDIRTLRSPVVGLEEER